MAGNMITSCSHHRNAGQKRVRSVNTTIASRKTSQVQTYSDVRIARKQHDKAIDADAEATSRRETVL